ncbi:hypothetical protein AOLI_G00056910 [Acnodon oligacanthus]
MSCTGNQHWRSSSLGSQNQIGMESLHGNCFENSEKLEPCVELERRTALERPGEQEVFLAKKKKKTYSKCTYVVMLIVFRENVPRLAGLQVAGVAFSTQSPQSLQLEQLMSERNGACLSSE